MGLEQLEPNKLASALISTISALKEELSSKTKLNTVEVNEGDGSDFDIVFLVAVTTVNKQFQDLLKSNETIENAMEEYKENFIKVFNYVEEATIQKYGR